MKTKFLILCSIVFGIALYLVFLATQNGTSSVLLVTELLEGGDRSRIRVAGRVATEKIDYQVEPSFRLAFTLEDKPNEEPAPSRAGTRGLEAQPSLQKSAQEDESSKETPPREKTFAQIPVVYEGVRPDMFAAGRDVIIDGDFQNGVLYATGLLTQCPSKYEAPKPGESYAKSSASEGGSALQHPSSIPIARPDSSDDKKENL